jgi:hypothetical protein
MSDTPHDSPNPADPGDPGRGDPPPGDPAPQPGSRADYTLGEVRRPQVSARVPEAVSRGVFSTGAIVIGGPYEIVLDFLLRLVRPHQVVARVVLPPPVLPQFVEALTDNLGKFRERFGPIPALPRAEPERTPSVQEVYEDLKLPDEMLAGAYANAVIISHTPAEFCFDFIAGFFPRSAVSARVYLSAPQAQRLLETLAQTYQEYVRRAGARRPGASPGTPGTPGVRRAPGAPGDAAGPEAPPVS